MKARQESIIPDVMFWLSLVISLANIVAAAFGFAPAFRWLIDIELWPWLSVPFALFGIIAIAFIWINSLMSNAAGMTIYALNIGLAPFGYEALGLPYTIGLIIAISPMPLFFGIIALSRFFDRE